MGAECTKSYQTQAASSNKGPDAYQIIITAFKCPDNDYSFQDEANENMVSFTKTLTLAQEGFKFVPEVGFKAVEQGSSSGPDEIVFKINASQPDARKLQLVRDDKTKLWRRLPTSGVAIKQSDEIRIGRNSLKLTSWLTANDVIANKSKSETLVVKCNVPGAECRFCLSNQNTDEDPLINPCKCTGSVSYVHQKCLSHWIFKAPGSFTKDMQSFLFTVKVKECQICKYSFQNYIWNRVMHILAKDDSNYAIFRRNNEILNAENNNRPSYIIFRLNQKMRSIKIASEAQEGYIKLSHIESNLVVSGDPTQQAAFIVSNSSYLNLNEGYQIKNIYFSIEKKKLSGRDSRKQGKLVL